MSLLRRTRAVLALSAASLVVIAGCATSPGSATDGPPLGSVLPAPPTGEVLAQGTVRDASGEVELCVGPIAESYPPQCRGIPIANWTWEGIDGSESSGGVTWGAYAVQGTFDGETFSVTQPPIMLALYDPMPVPDTTVGAPGAGTDAQLFEVQELLADRLGDAYLASWTEDGYLWVDVVWDDGTWQDAADEEFGDETVVIRSALRPIEE